MAVLEAMSWLKPIPQLTTLLDLRYQKLVKGGRGGNGMSSDCHGRRGEDRVIKVPVGTIIRDHGTGELLADLKKAGERVVIAAGGRGGKGNAHFTSSTNQKPALMPNPANRDRNGNLRSSSGCWPTSASSACPMPANRH